MALTPQQAAEAQAAIDRGESFHAVATRYGYHPTDVGLTAFERDIRSQTRKPPIPEGPRYTPSEEALERYEPAPPTEEPKWHLVGAAGTGAVEAPPPPIEEAVKRVTTAEQDVQAKTAQLQEYLKWRPASDVKTLGLYLEEGMMDVSPALLKKYQRKYEEYRKFYEEEYAPTHARYKSTYNVYDISRRAAESKASVSAEEMQGLVTGYYEKYHKGKVPSWSDGLFEPSPIDFTRIAKESSPDAIARKHLKGIVTSIAALPLSREEKLEMIREGILEPSEIKMAPEMVPAEAETHFGGMAPTWYAKPGEAPTPTELQLLKKREAIGEYLVEKGTPIQTWKESLFGKIPIIGEVGVGVLQAARPWGQSLRELGESLLRGGPALTGKPPWEGSVFTAKVVYSPAERMGYIPAEFPVPEPPGLLSLESVGSMIFYYGAFRGLGYLAKGATVIPKIPARIVERGVRFLEVRGPSPFSISARMEWESLKAGTKGAWGGIKWGVAGEKVTELRVIQEYPQRLGWVTYRKGGMFSFPLETYTELIAKPIPALTRAEVPPGFVPSSVVPPIGTRLPETHTLVYPRQVPVTSRWSFGWSPGREWGEKLAFTKATTKLVTGRGVIMVPKATVPSVWYSLRFDVTQLLYPYTHPVRVTKVVPRGGVAKTLVSETYFPAAEIQRAGISGTLYVGKPYHAATIEDIAYRFTQFEPLEWIAGKEIVKRPFAAFDPSKFYRAPDFGWMKPLGKEYLKKVAKQRIIAGGALVRPRLERTIGKIMGPEALLLPATTPSVTIGQVMGPTIGLGTLATVWAKQEQKPSLRQNLDIASIFKVSQTPIQTSMLGISPIRVPAETHMGAVAERVAQAQKSALAQIQGYMQQVGQISPTQPIQPIIAPIRIERKKKLVARKPSPARRVWKYKEIKHPLGNIMELLYGRPKKKGRRKK